MQGTVVVVTGAFGTLGTAAVRMAVAMGAKVAAVDYAKEPRAPFDGDVLALGGVDLTDLAAAEAVMGTVKQRLGGIDALLNIAGGFAWETLAEGDLATFDKLYALNVKTTATASKAALPHLVASGAGKIVNVGAAGAVKAGAGLGAYAASKAGVMRLTEALAEELKARNVTVNAVLPSIIDTVPNRQSMPDADFSTWVAPGDLAAVMLFLASDAAKAVTGALVPVVGRV